MPPLKSLILALVPLVLGLIAHARGLTVSDRQSADVANVVGLCLDGGAILLFWALKIHHDGLNALYALLQAHMDDPAGHTDDAATHIVPGLTQSVVTSIRAISTQDNATAAGISKLGVVLLAIGLAFGSAGCANGTISNPLATIGDTTKPPAERIAAVETVYNSTMIALTLLRQDGAINDKTWHEIRIISDTFNATVDSLKKQSAAGVPLDGNSAWVAANAALQSLVNQKGTGNGTNPGARNSPSDVPDLRGHQSEQRADDRPA